MLRFVAARSLVRAARRGASLWLAPLALLSIAAGCSCADTSAPTDTGVRVDASPPRDAPVASDTPTSGDAPTPMDAPTSGDAPTSMDAPTDDDAPTTTDAPALVDAGAADAPAVVDAGATDAPAIARVTIRDVAIYGNCFPVPTDPVLAFWEVDVAGASGSLATLVSATLTLTGPSTITQTLTVDVTSIALSGGSGTAAMRKTGGSPSTIAGCGEMCSGATFRLDLVFMIDGRTVPASLTGDYGCVF